MCWSGELTLKPSNYATVIFAIIVLVSAPLRGHCVRYALVGCAADFPPVSGWRQLVLAAVGLIAPSLAPIDQARCDDLRGRERRQVLKPQAGCLAGVMPELPRLDGLVCLALHCFALLCVALLCIALLCIALLVIGESWTVMVNFG